MFVRWVTLEIVEYWCNDKGLCWCCFKQLSWNVFKVMRRMQI